MRQGRRSAATLLTVCLIVLASGSRAWFLADEDAQTTTIETTPAGSAAPAAGTSQAPAAAPPVGGKVREASLQHRRIVEDRLIRMNQAQTSRAPLASHVTNAYWREGQLPSWLPEQVRRQFELENRERLRQRAGLPRPSTTPAAPVAEHVTRDFWESFPSWLNGKVKNEMQRDNKKFSRRLANIEAQLDTTTQLPAKHVTRMLWDALPTWLPSNVKHQFELDNQVVASRLSGRANLAAPTEQPVFEHVTRHYWENLPNWLPRRVRDEIDTDNRKYMMRLAGIKETTLTTQTTAAPEPTAAAPEPTAAAPEPTAAAPEPTAAAPEPTAAAPEPTAASRSASKVQVVARRIEPGYRREANTQPPTEPTRQLLRVESIDQVPKKCRQQLDWRSQPKCSSSRSKWTFDLAEMKCKWFAHYGCQPSNGNIFNSLLDCQNYCVRQILNPCDAVRCENKYSLYRSQCFLLKDTECSSRVLLNYSHIPEPEERLRRAKEAVELKCQPPAARCLNTGTEALHPSFESPPTYIHATRLPAHCELLKDRGYCGDKRRVRLARVYFYSKRQNQCKFMVNFGCSRNQNYFNSLADCYNSCGL